jgi:GNAT superfamily N-acetyltransferase
MIRAHIDEQMSGISRWCFLFVRKPVVGGFDILSELKITPDHNAGDGGNWITEFSTIERLRGHGLGRRLLSYAISTTVGRLSLSVHRDSRAVSLYERCGFVVVGEHGHDLSHLWMEFKDGESQGGITGTSAFPVRHHWHSD